MKNPRVSRRKEIFKIRAEINEKKKETKTKDTIANITKTKNWFFEKINKIDKPSSRVIKKKKKKEKKGRGEKNQINKIRNENREITTDNIQRIMRLLSVVL